MVSKVAWDGVQFCLHKLAFVQYSSIMNECHLWYIVVDI